ncbi:MAG: MAPEG family protein [Sphingomonadaceae bacterium]
MTHQDILHPVVALAVWTMIIWIWMYATRLPAMGRAKIDGTKMVGSTGKSLRDDLVAAGEEKASWVADNYNHLHEAPTVFYVVSIVLAMVGQGNGFNAQIAWAYVFLRVAHSLVQILSNRVVVRFGIFALSSIALIMLAVHAYLAVIWQH